MFNVLCLDQNNCLFNVYFDCDSLFKTQHTFMHILLSYSHKKSKKKDLTVLISKCIRGVGPFISIYSFLLST